MSESYKFFDSTMEDERVYSADEFAEFFNSLITSGILNGGDNLRVTTDAIDMTVKILEGYAWLEGRLYKIQDEPLSVKLDTAPPLLDRLDRVIIRFDNPNRRIVASYLTGVASESPEPPTLTRTSDIFEISLARVLVKAGKSFIAQEDIIDERLDASVCGVANSRVHVDASHLEAMWNTWMDGIRNATFIPKANYKEGFMISEGDLIHAIPKVKATTVDLLDIKDINKTSTNIRFLPDNVISIPEYKVGGSIHAPTVSLAGASTSGRVYSSQTMAATFIANKGTDKIEVTLPLQFLNAASVLDVTIHPAPSTSPTMGTILGSLSIPYAVGSFDGAKRECSFEVQLDIPLVEGGRYAIVFKSPNTSAQGVNVYYGSAPGTPLPYYSSTNGGANWSSGSSYQIRVEINDINTESSLVIDTATLDRFKGFGYISGVPKGFVLSTYKLDILDSANTPLMENVNFGDILYHIPLSGNSFKIRLSVTKVPGEKPVIEGFGYTWGEDISKPVPLMVAPSNNISFVSKLDEVEKAGQSASEIILHTIKLAQPGSYRVSFDCMNTGAVSYGVNYRIRQSNVTGTILGAGYRKSDVFGRLSIDIDGIAPNTTIVLTMIHESSSYVASVKNLNVTGDYKENTCSIS